MSIIIGIAIASVLSMITLLAWCLLCIACLSDQDLGIHDGEQKGENFQG